MATFRAAVDLNLRYRPTCAPWRSHVVDICLNPGVPDGLPLPAGQPAYLPDELAFVADHDLRASGWLEGFEWIETPSADELDEQRAIAEQYAQDGAAHFA